jgi:hypothetical protein
MKYGYQDEEMVELTKKLKSGMTVRGVRLSMPQVEVFEKDKSTRTNLSKDENEFVKAFLVACGTHKDGTKKI